MKSYEKKPAAPERIIQTVAATLRAVIYLRNRADGRFSFFTNTSIDALGHRFNLIETLHSRAFLHLVHPADRRKMMKHTSALDSLTKGNVATITMRLHHANGGWRWLEVRESVYACDDEGRPQLILGVLEDRTEELRYQNQLLHSEKLAALGGLVAGVAHEINNPLAVISGLAQLLERNPDPRVQEDAQAIHKMTNRAVRIVRSLLTFARHSDQESRKRTSIYPLIEETLELLVHPFTKANVTFEMSIEDNHVPLWIDCGQIQQVLLNLLINAIHAVAQKDKDERRIRLTTSRLNGGVCVDVTDTGIGIPPENIQRIFDPFFTTKDVGEGTGMGLSICHGIAATHGGSLTVESTEGKGATFRLWLPLSSE